MRLALFDGNGFDFLTNLSNSNSSALAALAFLFMCLAGIVIFNGLIGIFGGAFGSVEEQAEHNEPDMEDSKGGADPKIDPAQRAQHWSKIENSVESVAKTIVRTNV